VKFLRSPPWNEAVYVALDLETTGLDLRRDQILSVGMVPVSGGVIEWGGRYYSLVRPGAEARLEGDAIRIHHILPDELREAPVLEDVIREIARRMDGAVLLVHHAAIDVEFLRRAFKEAGLVWPRPPVVDTRVLVSRLERRLHELEPYAKPLPRGLLELCLRFGLPSFEPHHALQDALATAQLFLALRARLDLRTLRQVTV
jgi:DNA polymerase III subunit epsilon